MPRSRAVSLNGYVGLLLAGSLLSGCNAAPTEPDPSAAVQPNAGNPASTENSIPADTPPAPTAEELLSQADSGLSVDDLTLAEENLAALAKQPGLSAEHRRRSEEIAAQIQQRREAEVEQRRQQELASAERALSEGELEKATTALENVLSASPTSEESEKAGKLKERIEEFRKAQRELKSALKLLSSKQRSDLKAARTRFFEQPEVSLPLLLKFLTEAADEETLKNTLEILRQFNQPQRTFPAMVEVLSRPSQKAAWPLVVREIEKAGQAGAGEALLTLALEGEGPEQRAAALSCLAVVVDPPQRTLRALLPMVFKDGPELGPVLSACHRAVQVHQLHDIAARRGLDELDPKTEQLLDKLGERLLAVAEKKGQDPAADAALRLAYATRLALPEVFTNVKIDRVIGKESVGAPEAVLDGVWDTIDPVTMWRHPVDKPPAIVLDLGVERTVTAVRIWNYNESGGGLRGWKEVEIFVSNTASLLSPVAEGIVPPAPGVNMPEDYSVTISVPGVRGRYIKLQPRSRWSPEGPSGLSEIQVLGF